MGWAIALHGGAGDIPRTLPPERRQPREAALRHCLEIGVAALKSKQSALDVVELVDLEDMAERIQRQVFESMKAQNPTMKDLAAHATLNMIRSPFTDEIDQAEYPKKFRLPTFTLYDGTMILNRVRELENNPHFNAGKGSVLTSAGTVEMEACIMDGKTKKCGAVSGLTTVVNAISLARLVMEKTPHIYLAFDGAEAFAREQGVETVDTGHFITPENIERLKQAKEADRVQIDYTQPLPKDVQKETPAADGDSQIGTVGCVAVDSHGNLATATSTGGLVNKMVGRIGDTPIIGAGTYANSLCAVSATGRGEAIIRATVAREVAALVEYKGLSLKEAAAYVVEECAPSGTAGLVAVSATGEVTMAFNTTGMFRACATEDGYSELGIWPSV